MKNFLFLKKEITQKKALYTRWIDPRLVKSKYTWFVFYLNPNILDLYLICPPKLTGLKSAINLIKSSKGQIDLSPFQYISFSISPIYHFFNGLFPFLNLLKNCE